MSRLLGVAAKGQVDEAIACFRQAIEINPKDAAAYGNLGLVRYGQGHLDEAIACFHQSLAIDPNDAEVHCKLGIAHRDQGDFRAALASLRTGHALGSQQQDWRDPSAEWVAQCERLVQLDDLLAATRENKAQPAGPAACAELADFCRHHKQYPAAAVRFYAEAFSVEPKLAADL